MTRISNTTVSTQQPRPTARRRKIGGLIAAVVAFGEVLAGAIGLTPAMAEPVDVAAEPVLPADRTFIQNISQIGIPYPSESDAIQSARSACAQIAAGASIQDAVDGVRSVNPGLSLLQGAHFVWAARRIYCPGHRAAV